MGVIGVATFKRNLLQGSSNGSMVVLDRGPRGGPGESNLLERPHRMCGLDRKRSRKRSVAARLWAAVVERAHECANGETRRRSYCTDTTRSSRDRVDGNVVA